MRESIGDRVTADVDKEGIHEIAYWARDLAGNESDGAGTNNPPERGEVRIDFSPPDVAFSNVQDPEDPDRLEAPVADGLSGVSDGTISYRTAGTGGWAELPTELRADRLVARVDSNQLDRGVTYEFRAEVTDRAGNASASSRRADGSRMTTVGPFRAISAFNGFAVNGRRTAKLRYGRAVRVSGQLVDGSGAAIPRAMVELIERYAPGSRRATRSTVVEADRQGRFKARLRKGPSRSIKAGYQGDLRHLGTGSRATMARVRGAISLHVPKRVRAGDRASFAGRVRAKGAKFSRAGKAVEVQVRIGSRWKTVGRSVRTNTKGRYRLRYRFVATYTRPVRYRFRAVALRERGWPYLPAVSRTRSLVVAP